MNKSTLKPFSEVKELPQNRVGVLGATSLVGTCLLPLLIEAGWLITAFSRRSIEHGNGLQWQRLPITESISLSPALQKTADVIPNWICLAPIWVLPDYFSFLEVHGARRVVVLSSTSRFTKNDSTDPQEQATAIRLANTEARVQEWAESTCVEWLILRPTLIYGFGQDKNIAEITRFIRRFGFFPLFGKASGLRQPVHAADVASACLATLEASCAVNRAYNISGGETLSYRNMVTRVFITLNRRPRLLTVPLWTFRLAVTMLRYLPRYRQWSAAMAERMNQDLVFDHTEAARDLAFKPRTFVLPIEDLPL